MPVARDINYIPSICVTVKNRRASDRATTSVFQRCQTCDNFVLLRCNAAFTGTTFWTRCTFITSLSEQTPNSGIFARLSPSGFIRKANPTTALESNHVVYVVGCTSVIRTAEHKALTVPAI